MSERYTKLFGLQENLYAEGAPVMIAAGSLLKDNQTGKVLVQLKIRNIGDKTVKAAKVKITALDTVGRQIGDDVEYQYLDLEINRDGFFGQKTPIQLPDDTTRSIAVSVTEVAFSDNSLWSGKNETWETLAPPTLLEDKLGKEEQELVKQYRLNYGSDCKYWPTVVKDLWYCSCGELNHKSETKCHTCGKALNDQLNVDIKAIKSERDARLKREAEEREKREKIAEEKAKEQQRLAEERAKQESIRNRKTIVGCIATAVIILVILVVTKVIIPNNRYNSAVALMESGDYDNAIVAFEKLNGYKDSAEMIAETQNRSVYAEALDYMNSKEYDTAIKKFNALGDYSDCKSKIEECTELKNEESYQNAIELLKQEKYEEAYTAFNDLGSYRDSQEQKEVAYSRYLNIHEGDVIVFGTYEQDNDDSNGDEEIKWIILAQDDDKLLVISKYALDVRRFSSNNSLWNNCELRSWLNDSFYSAAFDKDEQKIILESTISNNSVDTTDRIFLLSDTEAEQYFHSDGSRMCVATAYVCDKLGRSVKICPWFLRTGGTSSSNIKFVATDGTVEESLKKYSGAVRPAMWISIEGEFIFEIHK
jgi:tetratricopeptide (TPR) repeat protein